MFNLIFLAMTKEEIKALIDAKIAGQGSAVDAGSALPAILNGILELAVAGSERTVIEIDSQFTELSLNDALTHILVNGRRITTFQEIKDALNVGAIVKSDDYYTLIEHIEVSTISIKAMGGVFVDTNFGYAFSLIITDVDNENRFEIAEV